MLPLDPAEHVLDLCVAPLRSDFTHFGPRMSVAAEEAKAPVPDRQRTLPSSRVASSRSFPLISIDRQIHQSNGRVNQVNGLMRGIVLSDKRVDEEGGNAKKPLCVLVCGQCSC